jgi:exosortase
MRPHEVLSMRHDHLAEAALPHVVPEQAYPTSPALRDDRWRLVARLGLAVVLTIFAGWIAQYAWRDMWLMALADPESSHVLLVPLVFVWLAWNHRHRLARHGVEHRWIGTLMLAIGWCLWSFGYRCQVQSFWHGGAVAMAAGATITILGGHVFIALLPAFGALVFLVPVPGTGREWIAMPLQHVTAHATRVMAEIAGMDVVQTGSMLRINGKDVAVAEACNGMRMVFTLFLACYVFAFVTPLRRPVRLLILLAAPVVAVIVNVIRLVPTVWAFGKLSNETAEKFHDISGWVMLVVAFLSLMGVVRLLRWMGLAVDAPEPVPARS